MELSRVIDWKRKERGMDGTFWWKENFQKYSIEREKERKMELSSDNGTFEHIRLKERRKGANGTISVMY